VRFIVKKTPIIAVNSKKVPIFALAKTAAADKICDIKILTNYKNLDYND